MLCQLRVLVNSFLNLTLGFKHVFFPGASYFVVLIAFVNFNLQHYKDH